MQRSHVVQILNGDPSATDVVLLIRRTVRPRGYASGSSLAAALLDSLLNILRCTSVVVSHVRDIDVLACRNGFPAVC